MRCAAARHACRARACAGTSVAEPSSNVQAPFSLDRSPVPKLRVLGPDTATLPDRDLQRLFAGRPLTEPRRRQLARCARVVAECAGGVLGLAAFERMDDDVRVVTMGIDRGGTRRADAIADVLLDAVELACQAGGGRRVLVLDADPAEARVFMRRGYFRVHEGCAGGWFEKRFR